MKLAVLEHKRDQIESIFYVYVIFSNIFLFPLSEIYFDYFFESVRNLFEIWKISFFKIGYP